MGITGFLLARITEDEEVAQAADSGRFATTPSYDESP